MNRLSVRPLAAAGLLCLSTAAEARQFFYIAEGGVPAGVVFETYPTINPNSSGATSASDYSELAYFTDTGLTGTKRDQFEFWAGASFGYTNPKGTPNSSGFGIATPNSGSNIITTSSSRPHRSDRRVTSPGGAVRKSG